jgi:hypothetical protein
LELYPYAYNTGDLTSWKEMSHPDCIFCASVVEEVVALHERGGHQDGGSITWLEVSAVQEEGSRALVEAVANEAPSTETVAGTTTEASSGGTSRLHFEMLWEGQWGTVGVGVESVER